MDMDDARDAWKAVADKVESLGLKLKLHIEQEADDAVPDRANGETRTAFEDLSSRVTDAFDAFGNAARDEGVLSDVRDISDLIRDALIETFEAVGAEVSGMIEQIEDYAGDAAEKLADALGVEVDLTDEAEAVEGSSGAAGQAIDVTEAGSEDTATT